MSKKLSEYTLGEMKEICKKAGPCNECIFWNKTCDSTSTKNPVGFDLRDNLFFTDGERQTARELMQCFGEDAEIKRTDSQWYLKVGESMYPMLQAFQSLLGRSNFTIRLEDILRNTVEL